MLKRCYSEKDLDYKNYGAKGIHVCDTWLCFEQFEKDLIHIEGYDKDLYDNGLIQLDKDKKQQNISTDNKIYSLETCCFISASENCQDGLRESVNSQKHRMKQIIAISPDGEEILVIGIRKFAREHSLTYSAIQYCLNGTVTNHKGWKFKNIQ